MSATLNLLENRSRTSMLPCSRYECLDVVENGVSCIWWTGRHSFRPLPDDSIENERIHGSSRKVRMRQMREHHNTRPTQALEHCCLCQTNLVTDGRHWVCGTGVTNSVRLQFASLSLPSLLLLAIHYRSHLTSTPTTWTDKKYMDELNQSLPSWFFIMLLVHCMSRVPTLRHRDPCLWVGVGVFQYIMLTIVTLLHTHRITLTSHTHTPSHTYMHVCTWVVSIFTAVTVMQRVYDTTATNCTLAVYSLLVLVITMCLHMLTVCPMVMLSGRYSRSASWGRL